MSSANYSTHKSPVLNFCRFKFTAWILHRVRKKGTNSVSGIDKHNYIAIIFAQDVVKII